MTNFSLQHFYLVVLISISSLSAVYASSLPTGFSLKLIHRDSPESPFYPGRKLTQQERMERDFHDHQQQQQLLNAAAAAASASSMNSSILSVRNNNNSISPNALTPQLYYIRDYLVLVGIGSFSSGRSKSYYLAFDTASDLLWLQCQGAVNQYPQFSPLYPWRKSHSLTHIPCHTPECNTGECYPRTNRCKKTLLYGDNSRTECFLAKETITVNADNGLMSIPNFIFGCGMNQLNFHLYGQTSGVMGLGGGAWSFRSQIGQSKFEYCLPSWLEGGEDHTTFLQFGTDTRLVVGGQGVQTTEMFFGHWGHTVYYVRMTDISVDGINVGYPPGTLDVKADGTGGCVFDTGTTYTSLSIHSNAYDLLASQLSFRFRRFDKLQNPPLNYKTCYFKPNAGFNNYPPIKFHFQGGAYFEIETSAAFYITQDYFCLNFIRRVAMTPNVIIGGIQQANHRILTDVDGHTISWRNEHCVANS